jgi:parallel beta-helix repeat protein
LYKSGAGNLISSNGGNGVRLSDPGTTLNDVQGNLIGTNQLGTLPLGNASYGNGLFGVTISNGAQDNLIGGTGGVAFTTGQGNLISGNVQGGVDISGAGTRLNQLQGNFIGTDISGASPLGNGGSGVDIDLGADTNTVGGSAGLANVISANAGTGVLITDSGSSSNAVESNLIGTTRDGKAALGNGADGVAIRNGASGNTIGGSSGAAGNLISGNAKAGVFLVNSADANTVQWNLIGTDAMTNASLENGSYGVIVFSSGDTVVDNLISGNHASGVLLEGSENIIQSNKIGTNFAGTAAVPNQRNGISIEVLFGAGGNTIGGTVPVSGNLISGNGWNGIEVVGPSSAGNLIEGNDIGTAIGGASALANTRNGILIKNASGYAVGGSAAAGNLISGNAGDGIQITGTHSSGIVMLGNKIGTDPTGTFAVANQGDGVHILNAAHDNTVGGMASPPVVPANLISGNQGGGVDISGFATDGNLVQGNFIGTTVTGAGLLGNQGDGVDILHGAANNQVGGSGGVASGGAGNLISGNGGDGVLIAFAASANSLLGNQIGTDLSGTVGLGNLGNGVRLYFSVTGNFVGTTGPGEGNLISGNVHDGVQLALEADSNFVQGDRIGTDISGAARLANGANGVDVLMASGHNNISSNLISGNGGAGVVMTDRATDHNQVQANLIGSTASGLAPLGNLRDGVDILHGAANNQVGGLGGVGPGAAGNVISGNHGSGVVISDSGSDNDLVQGNFIGTTKLGTGRVPNFVDGVDILNGAANNQIGGPGGVGPGGQGNLISGNGAGKAGDGVHVTGFGTNFNAIQGNLIGTDLSGKVPLGNFGNGVFIAFGAQHNAVGGTAPTPGNVIAFNAAAGVAVGASVLDTATVDNSILSNSIHHNGGLGIDLGDNGVSLNVSKNPSLGPNDLQNFPVILAALGGPSTSILIQLKSIPLTTFIIQVFANPAADPTGYGQGQSLVGTVVLKTNALGIGVALVVVPQNLAGQYVSATATAPSGDTSEFGKDVLVHAP